MPVDIGSTTFRTAAALIAASTAFPPSVNTRGAAAEASGWLVATMPFIARTGERLPLMLAAGRSPWLMFVLKAFGNLQVCQHPPECPGNLQEPRRFDSDPCERRY